MPIKINSSAVLILLILKLHLISTISLLGQCDRQRDSLALVDLYMLARGDNWLKKTNWLVNGSPIDTWYGVKTNADGCVQELNLNSNRLVGPISDSIVNLTELVKLYVNDNQLTIGNDADSLPGGWSGMQKLEIINMSSNILGGPVIAEFGRMTNLKLLNLSLNYFNKKLPSDLGNAPNLKQLFLNQNEITGSIPASFGQMANLEEFVLSQNLLSGNLPSSLGNLTKLRVFSVTQNKLTGDIPSELGNLTNVMFMYMNENQFTGSIPATFGNLSKLRELWINNNLLSGTIPEEIGQVNSLTKLILNNNQLIGNLPQFFSSLNQLVTLHVSNNFLTGSISEDISNMVNLESLHLDNNQFSGSLPKNIGMLMKLSSLRIHDNMFSGRLPESLSKIATLKRVYFHNNNLEGCIPPGYKRFCPLKFNLNVNADGYNFFGNELLQFQGDFETWCSTNYQINANFTSNAPVCEGSTLALMAELQNMNYNWQGPNGFSSNIQSPQVIDFSNIHLGLYSLTVTDINGCTATASVEIPDMIAGTIQTNSPLCEGKTIILTASEGTSFKWMGPNNFTGSQRSMQIINASKSHEGVYRVEIQTTDCVINKEIEIKLTTIGTVALPDTVCIGDMVMLQASGGDRYLWTGPDNFTSNQQNPLIENLSDANSGAYSVEISNADGCKSKYNLTLAAKIPETIQIDDFGVLCHHAEPMVLPLVIDQFFGTWQGNGVSEQDSQYSFNPSNLAGSIPLTFVPDASFYCVNAYPVYIFVPKLSVQGVSTKPVTNVENNNGAFDIQFTGSDGNYFTVVWDGPVQGEKTVSQGENIALTDMASGVYTLTVMNENGCMSESLFTLENIYFEINIPNVLSKNSVLPGNSVMSVHGQNIGEYDMKIYDRWGNLVHHTEHGVPNNTQDGWDVSTIHIQNGVYVVLIEAETPIGSKQFIESLTIID